MIQAPKTLTDGTKLLIALFALHAVFFMIACLHGDLYLVDSPEYLNQALNLKHHGSLYSGDWYQLPHKPEYYSRRPLLYGLSIMLLKLPFNSDVAVILFQNLLSILNIYGAYLLVKQFRPGTSWLLFAAGSLLFPAQLIYANLVMSEMLFQTCIFWAFFFTVKGMTKFSYRTLLIAQLLLVAALLTKPVMLYFWLPNVLLLIIIVWSYRKWLLLSFSLLLPLTLFAVSSYNQAKTGYFHYSSLKTANMLTYNAGYFVLATKGEEAADKFTGETIRQAEQTGSFEAKIQLIETECKKVIRQDLFGYAKLHIAGMLNVMLDPGRFDIYNFFGLQDDKQPGMFHRMNEKGYAAVLEYLSSVSWPVLMCLLLIACWNVVILLSFLFFVFDRSVPLFVRVALLIIVAYIITLTGPVGASRFKVPVYPLLLFTLPFFAARLFWIRDWFSYLRRK